MRWLGQKWESIKAFGIVLWPIRFILIVMLAMIGVLSLPQAKDALYGDATEGSAWRAAGLLVAVTVWAVQTWYWSRFLFDHTQTRGFPAPIYSQTPLGRHAPCFETWAPRLLGASVYWCVGLFALSAGSGWSAGTLYGVAGLIFLALTVGRRRLLANRGIEPSIPPSPVPPTVSRLAGIAGLVWLVLLAATLSSALWPFGEWMRQALALAIVGALAATSITLAIRLPLPWSTRWMVTVLVAINTILVVCSIGWAAQVGTLFGPAIILMFTAGAWIAGTSFFFAFPGERLRLPVASLLIAAALLFGFAPKLIPPLLGDYRGDFDNHQVGGDHVATLEIDDRVGIEAAFKAWKAQAPCIGDPCVKPMILVAAQGGASRSGYWVVSILGSLEDEVKAFPFHRSVFAISGVSGGSLGAAVYQRLIARRMAGTTPMPLCGAGTGANASVAVCGQRVLQHDFLGPVFFSMFNADLLQRLLPGDVMPDRAHALETAWELAWRREIGTSDFAEPFHTRSMAELAGYKDDWLPAIFLNGASVKTGRRIITSDIAIEPECQSSDFLNIGPDLPSSVDFFCLTRQKIRLSTAVHNSARFPYISPAGTLWSNDGAGHRWKADRIVDGGYVEAEGASTLFDILGALSGKLPNWSDGVLPIAILIENDPPPKERDCAGAPDDDIRCSAGKLKASLGQEALPLSGLAMRSANDFLAPIVGLASSRSGRGAYAARALEVALYFGGERQTGKKGAGWPSYRLNLKRSEGVGPAMSWYLSRRSQSDMAGDLCLGPKTDLDVRLEQFGQKIGVNRLEDAIVTGEGCANLRNQITRIAR